MRLILACAAVLWIAVCPAWAQAVLSIDAEHSTMTVRVFKSGLFSGFAHDHTIRAPIEAGEIRTSDSKSVELRIDSRRLTVLDPELAANKRSDVQNTMHSTEVLDSTNYPRIEFRSTSVEQTGPARWLVRGNLSLHGRTRPVSAEVTEAGGVYRGRARLRQKEFGITPIRVAGGTITVKDELLIEFEIQTRR